MKFTYGTAGFRGIASELSEVVKRTAYYTALRAQSMNQTIGLMITASHNPPDDNGVKVIDFTGGMLSVECEKELDKLVNSENLSQVINTVYSADVIVDARVFIGTDTRESAIPLLKEALEGCALASVPTVVYYQYTTPQLHYAVYTANDRRPTMKHLDYVNRFRNAYLDFIMALPPVASTAGDPPLCLDCANGVGALWVQKFFNSRYLLQLYHNDVLQKQLLNHMCGADYVKHLRKLPNGMGPLPDGSRCASLDGDADRLIYYYPISSVTDDVELLDGDHIAALFCLFIKETISRINDLQDHSMPQFSFGVVQTAYSNGNSKRFFDQLGVQTVVTKTGVKYLEAAARDFDIGVYFEANGHGTVFFSSTFRDYFNPLRDQMEQNNSTVPMPIKLLYYFSRIVNEVVGDGIADLLAVEALLCYYGWTIRDWHNNTFKNIPTVQTKVPVSNPSVFRCSHESEMVLVKPEGVQEQINKVVTKYSNARAFVRPSGTEPIIRILAEAESHLTASILADEIEKIVSPFF